MKYFAAIHLQVWIGWPIIYVIVSVFLVFMPLYSSPTETGLTLINDWTMLVTRKKMTLRTIHKLNVSVSNWKFLSLIKEFNFVIILACITAAV